MLNFFANLITTAGHNKENAANNNKREQAALGLKDASRGGKDAVKRGDKGEPDHSQQTFKALQVARRSRTRLALHCLRACKHAPASTHPRLCTCRK